jgi:hypothetical protein
MRKWLIDNFFGLLFVVVIFVFFALFAAMSWPILRGLTHLTDHFFIPYAPGSYLHLSGVSENFPTSGLGIASIPFSDAPNSIFVVLWIFALCSQIGTFKFDWDELPKRHRKGKTRTELIQLLWQRKFKVFASYTTILFVLCIPGTRCYQIITNSQIHYVKYFSLHEQSLPLSEVKAVRRYTFGSAKVHIGWELLFNDGSVLDLTSPNFEALKQLLALPQVTSNVVMRDGKLYPK